MHSNKNVKPAEAHVLCFNVNVCFFYFFSEKKLRMKNDSLSCALPCKDLLCKSYECWWNSANNMQIQIQTIISRQWPGLIFYLLRINMLALSLMWSDGCNPDVARNDEQMTSQDRKKRESDSVNLLIIRPHWIILSLCVSGCLASVQMIRRTSETDDTNKHERISHLKRPLFSFRNTFMHHLFNLSSSSISLSASDQRRLLMKEQC